MSKGKIITMIVAAVMVVSGISMLVVGLTVGASPVLSIGGRDQAVSKDIRTVTDTVDLSDFDKAEINVSSMDITIEEGSGYSLEYRVYEGAEPVAEVKGGHLTLKQPSGKSSFFIFDFRNVAEREKEYYKLTVPADLKSLDLDLDASSGDITVNGVNIEGRIDLSSGSMQIRDTESKDLELSASSGHINLENADLKELSLDVSSGDINLKSCKIDKIKGDSSSGEMTFDDIKADKIDLNSSSGDIVLNIRGDEEDYSFDIDTSSGDIKIGDKKMEDRYESGSNKSKSIKTETSSGDVNISFI